MSELTSEDRQAIIQALKSGQKIQAIKHYREATGHGLKEAKDFIDELFSQLHEQDPEAFSQGKSGCGVATLLLLTTMFCTLLLIVSLS